MYVRIGAERQSMQPRNPASLPSFLETLPEPHILCDRDYRIVAANAAYRKRCKPGAAIVGRTCYQASHRYAEPCDRMGESCPVSRSLKSGRRETALHLHHRASGEVYENIEVSPVRNGRGEIAYFIEKVEEMSPARSLAHAQGLIGRSPQFVRMLDQIARVAPSNAAVLLQGESGTGKELVAKAIHETSRRAQGPFVAIDCSGLPETLFESELFGHEKGAFTGAASRKLGLVEAAAGGTLFVDEVGDIPLALQVKLLRLLETGTFRRVGGAELRRADFRLVSATHRPLRRMAANGEFRQDLFYRLSTFPIALPALRERREDIPALAEALLRRVAPERALRVSPATMALLVAYDYPGNVRELRNVLERASLLCDADEVVPEHLTDEVRGLARDDAFAPPRAAPPADWAEIQRRALLDAAAAHRGSRKALAEKLGLSPRTLYRRLAEARAARPSP